MYFSNFCFQFLFSFPPFFFHSCVPSYFIHSSVCPPPSGKIAFTHPSLVFELFFSSYSLSPQPCYSIKCWHFYTTAGFCFSLQPICSGCSSTPVCVYGGDAAEMTATHGKVYWFSFMIQFYVPEIWNSLPEDVRQTSTLTRFRSRLKTVLFSCEYDNWKDFICTLDF